MKRSRRKASNIPTRESSPNQPARARLPTEQPLHVGKTARRWRLPSLTPQAAFTAVSLCVSGVGLWFSYNANETAFKSMQYGQRAYISVRELKITKMGEGEDAAWEFTPVVSNDGNSPTRNLRYRFGSHIFLRPGQRLKQQKFGFGIAAMQEVFKPGAENNRNLMVPKDPALMQGAIDGVKLVLAGQTVIAAGVLDVVSVPERDLKDHLASGMPFFILGQFDYDDVLSPTDHHMTKFCYVIYREHLEVPIGERGGDFRPRAALCDQWNCADDECAQHVN